MWGLRMDLQNVSFKNKAKERGMNWAQTLGNYGLQILGVGFSYGMDLLAYLKHSKLCQNVHSDIKELQGIQVIVLFIFILWSI